eukprot:5004565-Amphidinium_carterae.1
MVPQVAKMRASERASAKDSVEYTSWALPRPSASDMPVSFIRRWVTWVRSLPSQLIMAKEQSAKRPAPCGRPWGRRTLPVARARHCAKFHTHVACHAQLAGPTGLPLGSRPAVTVSSRATRVPER